VGRTLRRVSDFGRLTAAGLGLSSAVIGYASAGEPMRGRSLVGLLVVALCFHVTAFALNDIFDLDIDRTNPERAHSPLVAGVVTVPVAAAIIAVVAAGSVAADLAFFGDAARRDTVAALVVLGAGYLCLALYDIYTKRFPWPVLTDVVQGLGWAALVYYGALRAGAVTPATTLGAAFVFCFVVLVNGVHGGLRDLDNDLAHGSLTTATHLGARRAGTAVLVPARLRRYGMSLQLAMGVLAVVPAQPARLGWYAAGAGFTVLALLLCWQAFRAAHDAVRFKHLGATHILVCYVPVMCMAAATGGWPYGLAALAVMAVPMLWNPAFLAAFRAVPSVLFTAAGRRTPAPARLSPTGSVHES
jgi:4-hydroxybenzoate polyprenyltransferase